MPVATAKTPGILTAIGHALCRGPEPHAPVRVSITQRVWLVAYCGMAYGVTGAYPNLANTGTSASSQSRPWAMKYLLPATLQPQIPCLGRYGSSNGQRASLGPAFYVIL